MAPKRGKELYISSCEVGGMWVAVAYDSGGRIWANSLPLADERSARGAAVAAARGRGVASLTEGPPEKGKELAHAILAAGSDPNLALPLSFDGLTPFARAVLESVRRIPRGKVASYGDVARSVGRRRAWRAVGSVMAKNPFVYAVPCHRVVKSDLSPGEFGGDPEAKVLLLREEGVAFEGKRIRASCRLAPGK